MIQHDLSQLKDALKRKSLRNWTAHVAYYHSIISLRARGQGRLTYHDSRQPHSSISLAATQAPSITCGCKNSCQRKYPCCAANAQSTELVSDQVRMNQDPVIHMESTALNFLVTHNQNSNTSLAMMFVLHDYVYHSNNPSDIIILQRFWILTNNIVS